MYAIKHKKKDLLSFLISYPEVIDNIPEEILQYAEAITGM